MKKRIICVFLFCFSKSVVSIEKPFFMSEEVVNVFVWSGYFPQRVIQAFEAETGIRVNHSTYINNEVLFAKLRATPDHEYDVIMPSSYFIGRMVRHKLLQPIDFSKLSHIEQMDPIFDFPTHDKKFAYSVPYMWLATGIGINTKYHKKNHVKSWVDLWNLQCRDQLLMLDDAREDFSVALLTLGYSVNSTEKVEVKEAFSKLKSLMRNIKLFNSDAQNSIYLDEDITLGMEWNGDIFLSSQENPHLEFIYPEEGFVISIDGFAIPASAKHVENAHQFINFMLRPEIAREICVEIGFPHINKNTMKLLPQKMKNSPILYPSEEVMKRGIFQEDVGEVASLYEKYFEKLKLE